MTGLSFILKNYKKLKKLAKIIYEHWKADRLISLSDAVHNNWTG